jgi:hypothetical protein
VPAEAVASTASDHRPAAGENGDQPARLVKRESWEVGGIAVVVVILALLAKGSAGWAHLFVASDAPFFLNVARHPFSRGQLPGNPLVYGVAYRYGRIGFPIMGWLLAFGHPPWVPDTLFAVYVASMGAWVAFAAEHLRRNGRRPTLALWILALPFCLTAFAGPTLVSDPMAGALVLLAYLFERDGRRRAVYVTAALLILTREPMAVALLPLVWVGWKQRRFAAVGEWAFTSVPFVFWTLWVRVRVGQFPMLDPSSSRKGALTAPFVGFWHVWREPATQSQTWAMVVALLTLALAIGIGVRGEWRYPLTHGGLALTALVPFLGISVLMWPDETMRVLAPIQALLLIAVLDRGGTSASEIPPLRVRTTGTRLATAPVTQTGV